MALNESIDKDLREKFNTYWKRIEPYRQRFPLPTKPEKLEEYKVDITVGYNNLIRYYTSVYPSETIQKKAHIADKCNWATDLLKKAYEILSLEYKFREGAFEVINFDNIRKKLQLNTIHEQLPGASSIEYQNSIVIQTDTEIDTQTSSAATENLSENNLSVLEILDESEILIEEATVSETVTENTETGQTDSHTQTNFMSSDGIPNIPDNNQANSQQIDHEMAPQTAKEFMQMAAPSGR
ncbi:hypothetical protein EON73_05460, partial [bacterium]